MKQAFRVYFLWLLLPIAFALALQYPALGLVPPVPMGEGTPNIGCLPVTTDPPPVTTGPIQWTHDADSLAVEVFEYGVMLYVGLLTVGLLVWAINTKLPKTPFVPFVNWFATLALLLLYGATVLYYHNPIHDFLMGCGDHDETWLSAFSESYFPQLVYTSFWVAAAWLIQIRRRK